MFTPNAKLLNDASAFLAKSGVEIPADSAGKNMVINICLKTLIEMGTPVDDAMNIVLGEGSFQRVSDIVWNELN